MSPGEAPSGSVMVFRRQPEALYRLPGRVELDEHRRCAPDDPGVMAGLNDDHRRRRELEFRTRRGTDP